jgi:RES domain-containing protein
VTRAWKAAWFETGVHSKTASVWRGVEAQHVIATLKLTDSVREHEVLEALLEESKPPLPAAAKGQHFLLFTPFRYRSPFPSRFRRPTDPGVWYGAEELETACAEVAYWRWRFLMDSEGLRDQALHTEHTFFQAKVRGRCADLTAAPWKSAARAWTQKSDYTACQDLADEARKSGLGWIRYATVRAPRGLCAAILRLAVLSMPRGFEQQTWDCKTARTGVYLQRRITRDHHYEFTAQSFGHE